MSLLPRSASFFAKVFAIIFVLSLALYLSKPILIPKHSVTIPQSKPDTDEDQTSVDEYETPVEVLEALESVTGEILTSLNKELHQFFRSNPSTKESEFGKMILNGTEDKQFGECK